MYVHIIIFFVISGIWNQLQSTRNFRNNYPEYEHDPEFCTSLFRHGLRIQPTALMLFVLADECFSMVCRRQLPHKFCPILTET